MFNARSRIRTLGIIHLVRILWVDSLQRLGSFLLVAELCTTNIVLSCVPPMHDDELCATNAQC